MKIPVRIDEVSVQKVTEAVDRLATIQVLQLEAVDRLATIQVLQLKAELLREAIHGSHGLTPAKRAHCRRLLLGKVWEDVLALEAVLVKTPTTKTPGPMPEQTLEEPHGSV